MHYLLMLCILCMGAVEAQTACDLHLNDYFGTIVVINLPESTERLRSITEHLKKIGVNEFEKLHAINGRKDVDTVIWRKMDWNWREFNLNTPEGRKYFDRQRQGEVGCYLSHLAVIKTMKNRYECAVKALKEAEMQNNIALQKKAYQDLVNSSSVLILEDDSAFGIVAPDGQSASLCNVEEIFCSAMKKLPRNWDMLYFMTFSRDPILNQKCAEHLAKVYGGYSTLAYAVSHTMYDVLIAELSKIFDSKIEHVLPIDSVYATLQAPRHCYAIVPSIAYQNDGMSAITGDKIPFFLQTQPLNP